MQSVGRLRQCHVKLAGVRREQRQRQISALARGHHPGDQRFELADEARSGLAETAVGLPQLSDEQNQLQQLNLDADSTSDDARTAASSNPVPDPVITDDMKTSASDR